MPTRRLADRQIRAAQQAALRLDVRGPVSQALGDAGIVVPPAEPEAPAPTPSPAPKRRRSATKAAPRVVKPFQAEPWPTRRSTAEPASLSGLTADERRVHQILLDALAINSTTGLGDGTGVTGLSYLERKHLQTLDLAYINAEIAKMEGRTPGASQRWASMVMAGFGGLVLAFGLTGAAEAPGVLIFGGMLLLFVAIGVNAGFIPTAGDAGAVGQRKKIYHALRELALLVDPGDVTSEALAQADRLIDRIALDDAPAPASTPAARPRVRS